MNIILVAIAITFAAYALVADYCKFKSAVGYPCKSQERITAVAKTECPLSLQNHDSLPLQPPRKEMKL